MDLFIFTKMEIANHINEPRGFVVNFFVKLRSTNMKLSNFH